MVTGKDFFAVVTLAATACQPSLPFDVGLTNAKPVAYASIRDASGVLGYAEALLGPTIATNKYNARTGPGVSLVDAAIVEGAWELPLATKIDELETSLRTRGVVSRTEAFRDGQLWIADYATAGQPPVRLLLINGTHHLFTTDAAPEVRPGPHVYLIAYGKP